MLKWNDKPVDEVTLNKIVERAVAMAAEQDVVVSPMDMMMDIEAAHNNGCELDLDRLLAFPNFDFAHDVFGIRAHLNRKTGALEHCFLPRCARS